jgi:hypothetical protein
MRVDRDVVRGLTDDQVLTLYGIETSQVQSSLDHILRIRGMMAIAYAAILSATLVYHKGIIALGAFIFIAAWYWEYIYARYSADYIARVNQIRKWLVGKTGGIADLSSEYGKGYDHRITAPVADRITNRLGREPLSERWKTFFDLPRTIAYVAIALSPLTLANLLGYPWT